MLFYVAKDALLQCKRASFAFSVLSELPDICSQTCDESLENGMADAVLCLFVGLVAYALLPVFVWFTELSGALFYRCMECALMLSPEREMSAVITC